MMATQSSPYFRSTLLGLISILTFILILGLAVPDEHPCIHNCQTLLYVLQLMTML